MAEEKQQARFCPNCLGPAIRTGNEVACEACDAIFVITKKDGAKVKKLGPIEDHEQRLTKIEATIFAEEPKPKEQQGGEDDDEPGPDPEPESDNADQEGDILPR